MSCCCPPPSPLLLRVCEHQWHWWNGSLHTCSYSDIWLQTLSSCPNRIQGNVREHWDVTDTVVCSVSKNYIHGETASKAVIVKRVCKEYRIGNLDNIQSDWFLKNNPQKIYRLTIKWSPHNPLKLLENPPPFTSYIGCYCLGKITGRL